MTNDKDGAALLRDLVMAMERMEPETLDMFRLEPGVKLLREWIGKAPVAALKSHGQAFDAAGVREACAKVADAYGASDNSEGNQIAAAIRDLPIPETPVSVEPVAWMYSDGERTNTTRHRRADFVGAGWTETPLYTHPEPDTIGSNFGNGGGFDPVATANDCPFCGVTPTQSAPGLNFQHPDNDCFYGPSSIRLDRLADWNRRAVQSPPGFGGGDLREALWANQMMLETIVRTKSTDMKAVREQVMANRQALEASR